MIWWSMQGRVRASNTLSEQERSRKAFCRMLTVRFTAQVSAVDGSTVTVAIEAMCDDVKVLGAARAEVDLA